MKVEGPGKIGVPGVGRVGKAGSAGSTDFSRLVEGEGSVEAAHGVSAAAPASAVDALLSIQEVDDATERKSRAKRRAAGILDQLDHLRHSLLMGEISPHQLMALRDQIARDRVEIDDPRLAELMAEVELRAEVELAKLEMARDENKEYK